MKKSRTIIIVALLILVFMFLIPIGINEVYKLDAGYATKWDAADVLSFYGNVLGVAATIIAVKSTITFTYRQICRDNYLKMETEKWIKINSVFAEALDLINPIRTYMETMNYGQSNLPELIKVLQKYQIYCKTSVDQLNAYLSTRDYPKVKSLIDAIISFSEKIGQITEKEVEVYSKLQNFNNRESAQKTVDIESKSPHSIPEEILSFSEKVLEGTEETHYEDIQLTIKELNEQMVTAYQNTYLPLLQLKGMTFEAINIQIQKESDSILHLWRKSKCPPSNGSNEAK